MTASILNNRFIYVFGGGVGHNLILDTIEQYDIIDGTAWEIIDCKIPKGLRDMTSITISSSEVLLFGGSKNGGW